MEPQFDEQESAEGEKWRVQRLSVIDSVRG